MKRLSFIAALCVLPLLGQAEEKIKHVDAEKGAKLVAEGKVNVLDVRTPEEYGEGHIKGATNVDIMSKDFDAQVAKLDKSKPVLVHCQAGGRSTRSLPKLEKAGFTEIYHLDGGMKDWVKAGKPVEK
ncbi:MAG TPA: rhodanese-like domain-containing protein [Prosthecobacter sp.]